MSRRPMALGLCLFVWVLFAQPVLAGDPPRYSLRQHGVKSGPRVVVFAIPNVGWRELRIREAPHLSRILAQGAIGLMPVSVAGFQRTWVSLGAGMSASESNPSVVVNALARGGAQADTASLVAANRESKTHAIPGLLGQRLAEFGLSTAVVDVTSDEARLKPTQPRGILLVMDAQGRVANAKSVVSTVAYPGPNTIVDYRPIQVAARRALSEHDVLLLDFREAGTSLHFSLADSSQWVGAVDDVLADVMSSLKDTDSLIAVVCPEQPYYENPDVNKSMGPVILYETKHPRQGLLYTDLTRWPGVITAADFAPTVLDWWGIPADSSMEGHVLQVRPGGPADLDRLDRTLTDHYRWSFVAIPAHAVFGTLLVVIGLVATFWRRHWWPRLGIFALAFPLLPAGYLLAHVTGAPHLWVLLTLGFAFAFAIAVLARAASRTQPSPLSLALALLAGAAVLAADTFTGNHYSIISAYGPPPLNGLRFYGLGNEHMGFLVGLTVVGLAALWEWRPKAGVVVAVVSALMFLLVSAPFWGANWGGGVTVACTVLLFWLLAARPRWSLALPIGVAVMAVAAFLPGVLDMLLSPPATRTHIGAATALLLSNHTGSLGEMVHRKLATSFWVFCYTIWTPILAVVTFAAFWALLRKGGPVRTALDGPQKLWAGIAAALAGGVVSSIVNDSGIIAGAGLWIAALAACLYVAGRRPEARE